ncbi:MAG: alpha/beta hydrolase [Chloroflexi bacterium]|nr:alpha/beta hydrolase [Chloroflexota bacterium]
MSAITIEGELVHYEVLGRGRAVILVHGWLGSWRYWMSTMKSLQSKSRVYALDLLGFGDSGRNPDRYSVQHQIALLNNFMEDLGIQKAALIGHGLGALVAAEYAYTYAARVPRLLLSNAPLYDPGDLPKRTEAARRASQHREREVSSAAARSDDQDINAPTIMSPGAAMRAALAEASRARANGQQTGAEDLPLDPTAAKKVLPAHNPLGSLLKNNSPEQLLLRCFKRSEENFAKLSVDVAKTDPTVLPLSVEHFDSGELLDRVRQLPMPTVVIHGSDDPIIPPPEGQLWNYITADRDQLLAVPLDGVRHFPMMEDERFLRLTNEFLDAPDVSKLEIKERWRRRTR